MRKQAKGGQYWKSNVNDVLHGKYVGKRDAVGKYGPKTDIAVLSPELGLQFVTMNGNLEGKFQEIAVGSEVWITFTGKYRTKNGQNSNGYEVDYDDDDIPGVGATPILTGVAALKERLYKVLDPKGVDKMVEVLEQRANGDAAVLEASLVNLVKAHGG